MRVVSGGVRGLRSGADRRYRDRVKLECVSCGYDLAGNVQHRRAGVRCPECGDRNALKVVIKCVRCGFDLSGHADSHHDQVRCPECGEGDAGREPEAPLYQRAELRAIAFMIVGIVLVVACVVLGTFIGLEQSPPTGRWAIGSAAAAGFASVPGAVMIAAAWALDHRWGGAGERKTSLELAVVMSLAGVVLAAGAAALMAL